LTKSPGLSVSSCSTVDAIAISITDHLRAPTLHIHFMSFIERGSLDPAAFSAPVLSLNCANSTPRSCKRARQYQTQLSDSVVVCGCSTRSFGRKLTITATLSARPLAQHGCHVKQCAGELSDSMNMSNGALFHCSLCVLFIRRHGLSPYAADFSY
jgi:hypothetical protein